MTSSVGALPRLKRSLSVAWMLTVREWVADYRHSRMSAIWPLIHPIAYSTLFVLLRPILGGAASHDVWSFAVFVFIGFSLWQSWFEVLRAQMEGLRRHKGLMSRGELGASTLLLSITLSAAIQLLPRLLLGTIAAIWVLDASPFALVFFLVFGVLVMLNGATIGAMLQPFATLSPDLAKVVQSISLALLVTGAVFLVLPSEPGSAIKALLALNPLGSLLNAARAPLFGEALVNWGASLGWSVATVVGFVAMPALGRRVLPIVVERMGN